MKAASTFKTALGFGLVLAMGSAQASGFLITRASATIGDYSGEVRGTGGEQASDSDSPLGFELGGSWGIGLGSDGEALVLDLGYEFLAADKFDRTDILFTAAYRVGSFAPFIGYRIAEQDVDPVRDPNTGQVLVAEPGYDETGPFIGVSYGGVPLGEVARMGFSLAYNDEVAEFKSANAELDLGGISAKVLVSFNDSPFAVQLRYQRFSGDDASLQIADFTEEYLYLSGTWYFYKNSWK